MDVSRIPLEENKWLCTNSDDYNAVWASDDYNAGQYRNILWKSTFM